MAACCFNQNLLDVDFRTSPPLLKVDKNMTYNKLQTKFQMPVARELYKYIIPYYSYTNEIFIDIYIYDYMIIWYMYGLIATFHNFRSFFWKTRKPNLDTPQAQAIDGGLVFAVHSLQTTRDPETISKRSENLVVGKMNSRRCCFKESHLNWNLYAPWFITFSHLKMDGWKMILSFLGFCLFSGAKLLLVLGRVTFFSAWKMVKNPGDDPPFLFGRLFQRATEKHHKLWPHSELSESLNGNKNNFRKRLRVKFVDVQCHYMLLLVKKTLVPATLR